MKAVPSMIIYEGTGLTDLSLDIVELSLNGCEVFV